MRNAKVQFIRLQAAFDAANLTDPRDAYEQTQQQAGLLEGIA